MIPQEQTDKRQENTVHGGHFESAQSPFAFGRGEGVDAGSLQQEWVVEKERYRYDDIFNSLVPVDGKVTGAAAKAEMVKSKLPNAVLGKVWRLSDLDKDGQLDSDEWALAMHLINIKLNGHDLPSELPDHLIPPSKRGFAAS